MLRTLTICTLLFGTQCMAQVQYSEPDQDAIQQQKAQMQQVLQQADALKNSSLLKTMMQNEQHQVQAVSTKQEPLELLPNVNPKIEPPYYLDQIKNKAKNASIQATKDTLQPLVLVSFSMPDAMIKNLIAEAQTVGAMVAVQGLINDDFALTIQKLKSLAKANGKGVVIDPTLFQRFSVNTVPTFVLPLEVMEPCDQQGCADTKHVKASGSVTLQYFLEKIDRIGSDEAKQAVKPWLGKFDV